MKKIITIFAIATITFSCKKKDANTTNYQDGVQTGEVVTVENQTVSQTVTLEGGTLYLNGTTNVTADVNLNTQSGGDLYIDDYVEVHKINVHNGKVFVSGSPTIKTDFNINNGTAYLGYSSLPTDTIVIENQCNISDSLLIFSGVVHVKNAVNFNSGFISIDSTATLLIEGDLNQGGDIYGFNRIIVNGHINHNSGIQSNSYLNFEK